MARPDLVADCSACAALCCVATSFERSDDFAFDKPAGVPCRLLLPDHRCSAHQALVAIGCGGCVAYDCRGAGPSATRRFALEEPERRHAAFLALARVHELLWLLIGADALCPPGAGPRLALRRRIAALDALALADASALLDADLEALERCSRALLRAVGRALGGRRGLVARPANHRHHLR